MMSVLDGIPHVYCFTLPDKVDRHVYMKNQFDHYNINYSMVVMRDNDILHKLSPGHSEKASIRCLAYNCYLIDTLRNWYSESKDEYVILMEDDYDFSLIDLWHFSWGDLMDRLPYDWDCLQMGFECADKVRFYLHPIKPNYSTGPSLLKRSYVEKLISLFFDGTGYNFKGIVANAHYLNRDSGLNDGKYFIDLAGTPDYFICQCGKTYSLPLIPCNPLLVGASHKGEWYPMMTFIFCYEAYHEWWTHDRDKFTLDEFFSYGKNNDILMERDISMWDTKYFGDKYKTLYQKFK
jgi:hypothetical protein